MGGSPPCALATHEKIAGLSTAGGCQRGTAMDSSQALYDLPVGTGVRVRIDDTPHRAAFHASITGFVSAGPVECSLVVEGSTLECRGLPVDVPDGLPDPFSQCRSAVLVPWPSRHGSRMRLPYVLVAPVRGETQVLGETVLEAEAVLGGGTVRTERPLRRWLGLR